MSIKEELPFLFTNEIIDAVDKYEKEVFSNHETGKPLGNFSYIKDNNGDLTSIYLNTGETVKLSEGGTGVLYFKCPDIYYADGDYLRGITIDSIKQLSLKEMYDLREKVNTAIYDKERE